MSPHVAVVILLCRVTVGSYRAMRDMGFLYAEGKGSVSRDLHIASRLVEVRDIQYKQRLSYRERNTISIQRMHQLPPSQLRPGRLARRLLCSNRCPEGSNSDLSASHRGTQTYTHAHVHAQRSIFRCATLVTSSSRLSHAHPHSNSSAGEWSCLFVC